MLLEDLLEAGAVLLHLGVGDELFQLLLALSQRLQTGSEIPFDGGSQEFLFICWVHHVTLISSERAESFTNDSLGPV